MKGRIAFAGDVPLGFGYTMLEDLVKRAPHLTVDPAQPDVLSVASMTKSADELEKIRHCSRGAVEAMKRIRTELGSLKRNGDGFVTRGGEKATLGHLRRLLHTTFAEFGLAEDGESIVAQGRDAGVPHNRGNDGDAVLAGVPILIDIFPAEAGGGYHTDMTRTFCLGPAPEALKQVYGQCREAFDAAMSRMRGGEACRGYQELVCDVFERQGHATVRTDQAVVEGYVHGLGHGVGLAIHEGPRLGGPPTGARRCWSPDTWSRWSRASTTSRGLGVRIEDLVAVRADGGIEPHARSVRAGDPAGMKTASFEVTRPPRNERVVLVGHAQTAGNRGRGTSAGGTSAGGTRAGGTRAEHGSGSGHLERSLDELALLADTAGATVVDVLVQRRGTIHPATFLGKGKVEELKELAERKDAEVVIFDDDLSPAQVKNLEKALQRKVIDRSELILDIFARRARSRESRLQVELAQLEYTLPRLTGMWKHLERQAGGIGTRGPGETQLETDRRIVREKIARLKAELQGVERERETQRARRRREFRAALVGYTNAGKSTLFNSLTRAGVFVEDRLFATLDSTTRQLVSPDREVVLLTDTVGFIRKLPHHLVASFHSTLVEAIEADVLLHITDAADPDFRRQMAAVDQVLDEILLEPTPPRIMVFNKSDRLSAEQVGMLRVEFPDCVVISAKTKHGLEGLRDELFTRSSDRSRRGVPGRSPGPARRRAAVPVPERLD